MKSGKVSTMKAVALGVAVMFIVASCGSSDSASGGRTKNSALCFDTQADKDAAIEAAQAELDAANATTSSDASGGYRRPAVRSMSGDTTVPPDSTVPASDTTVVDSGPNIPMLEQALADAEAQPLCDAEDASSDSTTPGETTDCTATFTSTGVSWDCPNGERFNAAIEDYSKPGVYPSVACVSSGSFIVAEGQQFFFNFHLVNGPGTFMNGLNNEREQNIPIGFDVPEDTEGVCAQGEEESATPGETDCTATFASTGVSWECQSGERFNAAIEDYSNPNVYPSVECVSSGSFIVAEGQQFWFNFFLVNGPGTFINGLNTSKPQNEPIGFNVPEDTEGVCAEVDTQGDEDNVVWDSMPFKGTLDPQANRYSFTVPEDLGKPVYMQIAGDGFDVWGESLGFEGDCESICTASMVEDLAPGEYFFNIWTESDAAVTWLSNVEVKAVSTVLPVLPFSYTSDGSETQYEMKLLAAQTVTLTATAGQTCLASEDDAAENGFVDPQLRIHSNNYEVDGFDDNSGRGVGNCSASLIEIQLEPGTYTVEVLDDDREGASITLGSSVQLTALSELTWNLASSSVSPDATFEIVVPAGGSWFKANTVLDHTIVETYDEATDGWSNTGCWWSGVVCNGSFLVLLDANDNQVMSNAYGGQQYSQSTSNGITTNTTTNYGSSVFSVFLEEGTYTLAVMACCGPWWEEEPSTDIFQLNFGFGSYGAQAPQVEVVVDDNPTIPASVEQPKLPEAQLSVAGSAGVSLAEGVDSMVCDASCIEGLFASAGLEDGTISISAGGESVVVRKGQGTALISIGKNASAIIARAVSADGSKTATLLMNLNRADAALEKAMQEKVATGAFQSASGSETSTSSSTSGSSKSMYIYVLIALLIVVAIGYNQRRKKATETQ